MSLRDKKHLLWQILFGVAHIIDTVLMAVVAFVKCICVLPFFILIMLFASHAPVGTMEVGKD